MVILSAMSGETTYVKLQRPDDLGAWEPRDGHAMVTCKVRVQSGAYMAWEPRVYELKRMPGDWWRIDVNPGVLRHESWDDVVEWLWCMQPIDLDLVTTV